MYPTHPGTDHKKRGNGVQIRGVSQRSTRNQEHTQDFDTYTNSGFTMKKHVMTPNKFGPLASFFLFAVWEKVLKHGLGERHPWVVRGGRSSGLRGMLDRAHR